MKYQTCEQRTLAELEEAEAKLGKAEKLIERIQEALLDKETTPDFKTDLIKGYLHLYFHKGEKR